MHQLLSAISGIFRVSIASAVLLVILALLAPTGANAEDDQLVGNWYGHEYQPGLGYLQHISRRSADGKIAIEFRQYENCEMVWSQMERGTWWHDGMIETVEIEMIDGKTVDNVDHYEIIDVDDSGMQSRHVQSGMLFTYVRVSDEFDFPACERIS